MMMKRALATGTSVAILAGLGLFGGAGASDVGSTAAATHSEAPVCGPPPTGAARCYAHILHTGDGIRPDASTSPTGLAPATVKSAYGFTTDPTAGTGQTIAIVDAYDDPTVFSDLATFDTQYGLPCNSCLSKLIEVDNNGNGPAENDGWALEISLDVQWAHAIAPGANILLIEALDSSWSNLLAAEDYAGANAHYVSNSWGGSEFSLETSFDSHFATSGVSYFVSAGDAGLPAEYPSASSNVISVGGTTLNFTNGTFTSETGWSKGGGGCSSYESATTAQRNFSQYAQVNCGGKRATPDVSLDADPNSGVSVYDGTPYNGQTGWWTVGGTSASSPMWAARSAVLGATVNAPYVYGNNLNFRDITSGNNGASCLVGFDLCTGRGSWLDSNAPPPPEAAPTASFTHSCSGTTCSFDASGSTDADSYAWSGSFTASGVTTSHTYNAAGSYPVTLTVTDVDSGEQATATGSVTCSTFKHNRLRCS